MNWERFFLPPPKRDQVDIFCKSQKQHIFYTWYVSPRVIRCLWTHFQYWFDDGSPSSGPPAAPKKFSTRENAQKWVYSDPKGNSKGIRPKNDVFWRFFQSCLKYDKQCLGYVKFFSGPNNGDYATSKYFYMPCTLFQTIRTTWKIVKKHHFLF